MKIEDISIFEDTEEQIRDIYTEIKELSKKKPDEKINEFKLKYINRVLENANSILGEKNKPLKEFDLFNSDDLPSYSDITFILTHYKTSLYNYRIANSQREDVFSPNLWIVDGKVTDIKVKHERHNI